MVTKDEESVKEIVNTPKSSAEIINPKFESKFVCESEFTGKDGKVIQNLHNPATGEWKTKVK